MQVNGSNRYVAWILVLGLIALLQGIAISRDQQVDKSSRAYLSVSEDFSFLKEGARLDRKMFPVSMVANVPSSHMSLPSIDRVSSEAELDSPDAEVEEANHLQVEESSSRADITTGSSDYIVHVVKRGESLSAIARLYGMSVAQLVLYNGISNPDHIYPGYELQVSFEKEFFHTIKENDSLWSVARLYGVSVKSIQDLNQLSSNSLSKGQKLRILVEDLSEKGIQRVASARNKKSSFIWPVKGRVTDEMGWRIHPITKKKQFHKGMDVAAPIGEMIGAAEKGKVVFSGFSKGYGNLVILEHAGGYRTRYAHCSRLNVKLGDSVVQGQKIAEVGQTGVATGSHLHFEIRKNGRIVNPREML